MMLPWLFYGTSWALCLLHNWTTLYGQTYVYMVKDKTPDHHTPIGVCWTCPSRVSWASTINASVLLGRLSTGFWNMSVGICAHSDVHVLVRLRIDFGWGGLVCSLCSSSSHRCSEWLRCRLLKFFHSNLGNPCLYRPLFVHSGAVMLEYFIIVLYYTIL